MLSIHANVYKLPATAEVGPTRALRGLDLPTLIGANGGPPLFLDVLPITFEAMQQRLMELPRCDCEPDGFFLLTGHTEEGNVFWKLNGHMQEYQPEGADEPSMHRTELNGECPEGSLDLVLRSMGWPDIELAFELVKEGATLREEAFRQYAASHNARATSSPTVALAQSQIEADAEYTPWHITFGTYGTRLHGDRRPTVDREHNEYGTPFVERNDLRKKRVEASLSGEPIRLTQSQREFIELSLPAICERGGWKLRVAAAQPDHVHVVCDIRSDLHGEKAQRLMKRWLSEALNAEWPDPDRSRWWAVQGSNKAIKEESYLQNAIAYVKRQRATQ